uniref:DUF4939 domain-containing protein n=1 Tax=Nothobranchius furzeri TaxID=105023 RepID=A0A8C6Q7W6_NOTFU
MVDRQSSKIDSLTDLTIQLSVAITALQQQPALSREEPQIGLLERWDGSKGSLDGLLATLDMMFECQPSRYISAQSRVALLTSLLTGRAQEWAAALYNKRSPACNDYVAFVAELRKTFAPPTIWTHDRRSGRNPCR